MARGGQQRRPYRRPLRARIVYPIGQLNIKTSSDERRGGISVLGNAARRRGLITMMRELFALRSSHH